MPVSVLLCEGGDNSLDVRLLGQILRGTRVVIEPSGGKDGFTNLIHSRRRSDPRVCGLSDGDFPRSPKTWVAPSNPVPPAWTVGGVVLGWHWRRKEVENYTIDPDIVARVFRWTDVQRDDYSQRLSGLLDALAYPTAARMALTACAPRKRRVETSVPLGATKDELEAELKQRVTDYNTGAQIDEARLLEMFAWCATESSGGAVSRLCARGLRRERHPRADPEHSRISP